MAKLVVALDFPTGPDALSMAKKLRGTVEWMKVGLELYTAEGQKVIASLKEMGFKVFLDLKFFDIPNTVKGAVRSGVCSGADMLNIHIMGGERMTRAAVEGLAEGATITGSNPFLLGVTVLTSMSNEDLPQGLSVDIASLVPQLARNGKDWGLNGVVCSGFEIETIKQKCGKEFICLTPGIRPVSLGDDQRRTMTPAEAVNAGSDYLVVGRPITGAENPAEAAQKIIDSMQ